MNTTAIILLIIVGLAAGTLGSMVGIGGGMVVVPALIAMSALLPGMNPKMATGTSLAMLLPPIGVLGVIQYYKNGNVDFRVAAILCIGFIFGSYLGAKIINNVDRETVKKIFAVFLLLVSLKFLFFDKPLPSKDTTSSKTSQQK